MMRKLQEQLKTVQKKKESNYRSQFIDCSSDSQQQQRTPLVQLSTNENFKEHKYSQKKYSFNTLNNVSISLKKENESETIQKDNKKLRELNDRLMNEIRFNENTRNEQLKLFSDHMQQMQTKNQKMQKQIHQMNCLLKQHEQQKKKLLKKIKDIEKEYQNKLTNQKLSQKKQMKPSQFQRQMKQQLKIKIKQFIEELKTEKIHPKVEQIIQNFCTGILDISIKQNINSFFSNSSINFKNNQIQIQESLTKTPNNKKNHQQKSKSPLKMPQIIYNKIFNVEGEITYNKEIKNVSSYQLLQQSLLHLKNVHTEKQLQSSQNNNVQIQQTSLSQPKCRTNILDRSNIFAYLDKSKSRRKKIFG